MSDNKNANKEILLNPKEEKEENNNIDNNEQEGVFNYINPEPEQNNILKSIMDDIEYIDIKKTIIAHGNKSNDEIESKLQKTNNYILKLKNLFQKEFDFKIEEEDNKSADGDYHNLNKDGLFNRKKLITEKEFCEKKMEENIKYIKYFSRKNYEDIRDKKKRNLAIFMISIMVFVFFMYFICSKYQNTINSFLKEIILSKK